MKFLIVRGYGNVMNTNMYNCQEIGLAKALSKQGIECGIVFYNGKNENCIETIECENKNKIVIYRLRGISIAKHGIMNSIDEIVDKYDVIWVNEFNQYTSYKICKRNDKKIIIYHGPYSPIYSKLRFIRNYFYNKLFFYKRMAKKNKVFTKSNLASRELLRLGFEKVETIGVGLDNNKIHNLDEKPELLNEILSFRDSGGFLLTYIGTIDKRKNTIMLLKILKKLIINNRKVKLLIIGKGNSKYINKCIKYINENNLKEYIIYREEMQQNQLGYIYKNTDIFLLPTCYEIFGMVLLEAMYYGIPVITTENGGSSTLINDKKNGFICNNNNIEEWIVIIEMLLSNKEICGKIGKEANSTITSKFTWDVIAEKVIKYLDTI
ncbi:glycosyltransferase family 4 protein [Clostridium nigeriense]|uniref:glycosyltransferase family 4 protein n=1 Tax=Clostridium nigeriense TaxID=1805470 RepID=UPI003D3261E0